MRHNAEMSGKIEVALTKSNRRIEQNSMPEYRATAEAHANIAFIKYWGNQDEQLRLPANPSLSMNLDSFTTRTQVRWEPALTQDTLVINGQPQTGAALTRVVEHLNLLRNHTGISLYAEVKTNNNFPMGAGIASSAAAFAALTVAGLRAADKNVDERTLTTLARQGSGSAARSVPDGFVEWVTGDDDASSYAYSVAPRTHWELMDVVAIVSQEHKAVGSRAGHSAANTSDLQTARVTGAAERLAVCRQAVLERDFGTLAEVVEHDSNLMHAVMMTSRPPLFYWMPTTLSLMQAVRQWRADGLRVCYTLDAGPNVHCICVREDADEVSRRVRTMSGVVDIRQAAPGGGARIIEDS